MGSNRARNIFFEQIGKVIEQEDIYIVAADLAGPPFDVIRANYPSRYIPVGISEQNMISVSIGLSLAGKKVIAYAANPFVALRALDQIRNGVSLMRVPVTIVGLGTGFSVWECGTSHFTTEDIALLKLCPGLRIITVTDDCMAEAAVQYVLKNRKEPTYLRFDRDCTGVLSVEPVDFQIGFRILRRAGSDVCVITEGYPVHRICAISWDGADKPTILEVFAHPFDRTALLKQMKPYKRLVVCEEQQYFGGLGADILDILNEVGEDKDVVRMAVDYGKTFPEYYGSRDYWFRQYGLDETAIRHAVSGKGV